MRFALTEDQADFRDAVADLMAGECPPEGVRAAWNGETGRTPKAWAALGDMGVLGVLVPESAGGLGLGMCDLIALCEATGAACLPEPFVESVAVAAPLLAAAGADERAAAIVAGDLAVTTVLGGIGSSVPWGTSVDAVLVVESGEVHLVPTGAAGLVLTAQDSVDGARRLARVDAAPLDATTQIAVGDAAADLVAAARVRAELAIASQLVGLGRHLLDVTVQYAKDREQFAKPIGAQQAIKHQLADAYVALEFARPLAWRGAWSVDAADPDAAVHAAMAKAAASDAAWGASRTALQCHGAIGYTYEYDLTMWMKRVWCLAAAWGSADAHRETVAVAVLDGLAGA